MALGNSLGGNAFTGSGTSFGSSAPTSGGFGSSGAGGNLGGWIGLASSAIGLVSGLFRGRKARRMERENPYPVAETDSLLTENQARAQQMAQVGLPQAQYNLALQNIQRNQAGALRAAQTSGRPVNVASILGQTNQATLQLDAADAAARIQNQRLAMQQNSALAAENQRVWNWNEAQRYQELAGRIAQLRAAGQQDLWGGIGMLGQLAASGVFNGMFGGNNSGQGTNNSGGGWLSGLFGGGSNQTATNQPGTYGFGGYNTLGNQPTGMAPYYGPAA